jgi:hypothetical protein
MRPCVCKHLHLTCPYVAASCGNLFSRQQCTEVMVMLVGKRHGGLQSGRIGPNKLTLRLCCRFALHGGQEGQAD